MLLKWSLLEAEQIELGYKAGLNPRQIRLYAKHRYNFLQMQEIRTALCEGLDEYQIGAMCRMNLTHEEMERIRKRIEKGEKVRHKTPLHYWLAVCALSLMAVILILDGYVRCADLAYLNLKQNEVELGLNEPFEPMKYVESTSSGADHLKLPYGIDTSLPGTQAAVYTLNQGNEEITRILLVKVKEDPSS